MLLRMEATRLVQPSGTLQSTKRTTKGTIARIGRGYRWRRRMVERLLLPEVARVLLLLLGRVEILPLSRHHTGLFSDRRWISTAIGSRRGRAGMRMRV